MKEYYVDAKKCRLIKSHYTYRDHGEYYHIDYKNYKRYGKGEYPTVMKIYSSNQDMFSATFRELKFDCDIPEHKLRLHIPPESKKVELLRVQP